MKVIEYINQNEKLLLKKFIVENFLRLSDYNSMFDNSTDVIDYAISQNIDNIYPKENDKYFGWVITFKSGRIEKIYISKKTALYTAKNFRYAKILTMKDMVVYKKPILA